MKVRQISVFIENEAGRLYSITNLLGSNGINIRGFAIADTSGYGIFRIIVDDTDKAVEILKKNKFVVNVKEVICANVPDKPGGLAMVLKSFSDRGLNVEYMYAMANTLIIFNIDDIDRGIEALRENNIKLYAEDEVAKL